MALLKLDGSSQLTPLQQLALAAGGGGIDATPTVSGAAPSNDLQLPDGGNGGGGGTVAPAIPPTVYDAPPPDDPTQASGYYVDNSQPVPTPTQIGYTGPQAPDPGATAPDPGSQPAGPPTVDTSALETDPAYQAQKAEDDRLLNQAASGTLASTKDLLLGYGSQELAKQTLDQLLQDPKVAAIFTPADEAAFLQQISANPDTSMSTLARIARQQRDQAHATDESLNSSNLYYSGTRAQDLGKQAYDFQGQSADARGKMNDALSTIAQAYLAAQNSARAGDLSGFQAAYDRALQEAEQYGTGTDPTDTHTGATDPTGNGQTATTPPATKKGGGSKVPSTRPAKRPVLKKAPQLVSEHGKGGGFVTPAKPKKPGMPAAPVKKPYMGRH